MENKSLKLWKIFALILIALNITLIVLLILGRPPHRQQGDEPGKYLIEKLKFTESQQAEYKKLREAHRNSVMAFQEEVRKLRTSFFDGLISDTVNSNEDSIANKIAENQKQIELVTYSHFQEVKRLCTSEQKIIFNDIIQDVIKKIGKPHPEKDKMHN